MEQQKRKHKAINVWKDYAFTCPDMVGNSLSEVYKYVSKKYFPQFMLGNTMMVAPMLSKNKSNRDVIIPKGMWKTDDGKMIKGPAKISIQVPLERLPYFQKIR